MNILFIIYFATAVSAFRHFSPYHTKLPAPWMPSTGDGEAKLYTVDYPIMLPDEALGELFFSTKSSIDQYKQSLLTAAKPPSAAETGTAVIKSPFPSTNPLIVFDFEYFTFVILVNTVIIFLRNIIISRIKSRKL